MRKNLNERMRLHPNPRDFHHRFFEVRLCIAGDAYERNERFFRPGLKLRHVSANLGRTAFVAELVTQTLKDAPARVALLGRRILILLENLCDLFPVGTQHRPGPLSFSPVARGNRLLGHLLNRAPVQAVLTTDLAHALAFD